MLAEPAWLRNLFRITPKIVPNSTHDFIRIRQSPMTRIKHIFVINALCVLIDNLNLHVFYLSLGRGEKNNSVQFLTNQSRPHLSLCLQFLVPHSEMLDDVKITWV